jgi:hypothetical protein
VNGRVAGEALDQSQRFGIARPIPVPADARLVGEKLTPEALKRFRMRVFDPFAKPV